MNETKTLAVAGRAEYSRKTAEASGMDRVVSGPTFPNPLILSASPRGQHLSSFH